MSNLAKRRDDLIYYAERLHEDYQKVINNMDLENVTVRQEMQEVADEVSRYVQRAIDAARLIKG